MPDPKGQKNSYRWCEAREQRVALSVCEKRASEKPRCRRCLAKYQQLGLSFTFQKNVPDQEN